MSLFINKPYQISTYLGSVTALSGIKGITQVYSVANDNTSFAAYSSGMPFNSLTHLLPFSGYLFNTNQSSLPLQLYSSAFYFRPNQLTINGSLAFVTYYGNSPLHIASSPLSSNIIAAYSINLEGNAYISYISGFPFNSLTTLQPNSGYILFSVNYPYEFYNNPLTPTPTPSPTITPSPYYSEFTLLKIEPLSPSSLYINIFHSGPVIENCGYIQVAIGINSTNFTFITLDNCSNPSHAMLDYPGNWYIKLQKFNNVGTLIAESNILYYNSQTGQYSPAPTPLPPTPTPTPTVTPTISLTPSVTPTSNPPTPTPTPTTSPGANAINFLGSDYFVLSGGQSEQSPGFGESTNSYLDSTTAWFGIQFFVNCYLTFTVVLDSEIDYDFGAIYINGEPIYYKSGIDSTTFINIPLSVNDIFKMEYIKDEAVSEGLDKIQFYDFICTLEPQ